jgi:hypothetical protein
MVKRGKMMSFSIDKFDHQLLIKLPEGSKEMTEQDARICAIALVQQQVHQLIHASLALVENCLLATVSVIAESQTRGISPIVTTGKTEADKSSHKEVPASSYTPEMRGSVKKIARDLEEQVDEIKKEMTEEEIEALDEAARLAYEYGMKPDLKTTLDMMLEKLTGVEEGDIEMITRILGLIMLISFSQDRRIKQEVVQTLRISNDIHLQTITKSMRDNAPMIISAISAAAFFGSAFISLAPNAAHKIADFGIGLANKFQNNPIKNFDPILNMSQKFHGLNADAGSAAFSKALQKFATQYAGGANSIAQGTQALHAFHQGKNQATQEAEKTFKQRDETADNEERSDKNNARDKLRQLMDMIRQAEERKTEIKGQLANARS